MPTQFDGIIAEIWRSMKLKLHHPDKKGFFFTDDAALLDFLINPRMDTRSFWGSRSISSLYGRILIHLMHRSSIPRIKTWTQEIC